MNTHFGAIESLVRVLVGLPMAVAYFYARHYDSRLAYLFLIVGLALLAAGLDYELKATATTGRRSK